MFFRYLRQDSFSENPMLALAPESGMVNNAASEHKLPIFKH